MQGKPVNNRAAGQPKTHDSAALHVSGEAVYTDDIAAPAGCLHAYMLQSPHAHAKIISIDTSACHIAGVHAVMTARDVPGVNDVAPVFAGDPVFAENEVLYAGQSVLAVAAESIDIARRAAQLAKVEYQVLPAILDVHESLRQQKVVG